ncbi:MAG: hypothetical protein ACC660_06320, partial [Acidimicrobiales bacterium]
SRDDFIAVLAWPGLSDHQRDAVHQVLRDGAYDTRGYSGAALTAASLAPVVGDVVDGIAAVYFAGNGDYTRAVGHAVGVIPVPGVSGATSRFVARELSRRALSSGGRELSARLAAETVDNVMAWGAQTPVRSRIERAGSGAVVRPSIIDARGDS